MAVFTAATLAVSAAIATTTAATVATAVVAVSTAIGVAGLAVTAVGMVTKNESLMKAGKIMGYVGLAGGLAGGAIGGFGAMASGGSFVQGAGDAFAGASQFIKEGWDSGVGSFFSGGDKIAGPIGGGADSLSQTTDKLASVNDQTRAALDSAGNMSSKAGAVDMSTAVNTPSPDVLASQQAAMGAPVPAAPAPAVPTNPLPPYAGANAVPIPGAPAAPASPGFLSSMPEWSKYAMMTTAGQGLSGLASGYFTGLSAEEQLKQKQLENQQTQNQIQLLNRQGSYAPLIRFRGPGLANSGGR